MSNWTQAMMRDGQGCSEGSKTYQSVQEIHSKKQHCVAVVECSLSTSLTEWQFNPTLWMKLCLIFSQINTNQTDTGGGAKQTKLKYIEQESSRKRHRRKLPTHTSP